MKAWLACNRGTGRVCCEVGRESPEAGDCIPRDHLKPHLSFEGQRRGMACAGVSAPGLSRSAEIARLVVMAILGPGS